MEQAEDKQVDRETGDADRDNGARFEVRGFPSEAADRFKHNVPGDGDQERDVDGNREDLGAGVAKGAPGIGRPASDRRGREREDQAGRIGEHVAGVGDEREGAGEVPGCGLDGDEEEREKEAQEESPVGAVVGGVHATMVTGREAGNPARC